MTCLLMRRIGLRRSGRYCLSPSTSWRSRYAARTRLSENAGIANKLVDGIVRFRRSPVDGRLLPERLTAEDRVVRLVFDFLREDSSKP
jgi:hypothetical protein